MNQDSPWRVSRRKVITVAGSLTAFSIVPTAAGAETASADEMYKQSLQLRRKNEWDNEKWRKYLQEQTKDREISLNTLKMSKPMQPDEGGEVGPQNIQNKDNLNLTCTLFGDGVTAYADMDFEAENSVYQLGFDPKDGLAFGWDGDEYDYDGDSENGWYASDKSLINIESYSGRGVSFGFKDRGHVQEGHWVSVNLLTEGGTGSSRNVIFSYMHTWNGTDIKSISVSTDGTITVELVDNTKKWDSPVQDQLFEDTV